MSFNGFDIFVIILVFLIVLTLYLGIKMVPQGYCWTVERFGKYTRTLPPGLHFLMPFIYAVGRRMNILEQVLAGNGSWRDRTCRLVRKSKWSASMAGC